VTGGGRPEKHSVTLKGHRTSVSLEPEFWAAFRAIARVERRAINELAAEIDAARGSDRGLASAIRVFVLGWHAARSGESAPNAERPAAPPVG
jgi:predicted DNA-binding ribbon-helix-helix protein